VDHVCSFVERNQVTWYDKHNRPIKFDRKLITESVTITITELREKQVLDIQQHLQQKQALQKYIERSKLNKSAQWSKLLEAESANQQQNIDIKEQVIDEKYYLLAIFNEIMNTCAELNDKYTWMCKSMGMSQYHDMLVTMYGPERLRYIYLVRDPRDVTLSFMKTPVGDCHPYMIAKKWSRLQDYALRIKNINPELIHEVKYEDVIRDKVVEVAKINKFIGKRRTGKVMRRGSIVMIKSEAEMTNDSKHSNESVLAAKLSYQFKNLTRGDSFTEKQFQKWKNEMDEDDIHLVELVAKEQMERLGYECNSILDKNHDNHNFSEEEIKSFEDQNKILIKEMNDNLAIENPGDFKRRLIQAEVLTFEPGHLPDSFKEQKQIVLDKSTVIIDSEDEGKEKTEPELHDEKHDFRSWPKGADQFGYLSEQEIDFHVSPCHQVSVKKGRVISYAVASQCGYYPRERGKKNQDSYIAGLPINSTYTTIRKSKSDENRTRRVLFSVFDGHGRMGEECSTLSRDAITEDFSQRLELCKTKKNCKRNVQKALFDTYLNANDKLQQNESVNTSQSGTTAISLCIDRKYFHVANVGDSRCIVASSPRRQWKCRKSPASEEKLIVDVLSNDHTPDRLDEAERIKSHGGLVMTLEQYDNEGKDDSIPRGTDPLRIWSKNGKYPGKFILF
jgi:serine/threonine protein phosphatase PrpC